MDDRTLPRKTTEFQFHYGSVKSFYWQLAYPLLTYFNSTMVRLKVISLKLIKQASGNFNSTMVRLKDGISIIPYKCESISIPLWFG